MKSMIFVVLCLTVAVLAVTDEKRSFTGEIKVANASANSSTISSVFSTPAGGKFVVGVNQGGNLEVSSTVKPNTGVRLACNTFVAFLPIAIGFLF